jgi:hypothetical protein
MKKFMQKDLSKAPGFVNLAKRRTAQNGWKTAHVAVPHARWIRD